MPTPPPRLLFLVNVDWFFLSHRLPIALAAKEAGFDVVVAAADTGKRERIEAHGLKFIHIPFSRKGTNFFSELAIILKIYQLYRSIRPDLVHHVSIKPVIYGSLVSRFFPKTPVVNAVTGMGFVFSGDKKAITLHYLVKKIYRIVLGKKRMCIIFQNNGDLDTFLENKLVSKDKTVVIRGSGVNCDVFKPNETIEPQKNPVVLLASRMIMDKGIKEFVEAASIVKKEVPEVRFVLAGMVDTENPNTISAAELQHWEKKGLVEWWGHREDMANVILQSTIVALPTYYPEGVPKILIEAAASGKTIITTNRPGCNDIVREGLNGMLIPEKNAAALAEAIITLLKNPGLVEKYGKEGRKLVEQEFSEEVVVRETLKLYHRLLNNDSKNYHVSNAGFPC